MLSGHMQVICAQESPGVSYLKVALVTVQRVRSVVRLRTGPGGVRVPVGPSAGKPYLLPDESGRR